MRAETRHQLKQDAFSRVTIGAAEKTAHWTVEHRSTLMVSTIAAIVIIAAAIGGWYYLSAQDEKASLELTQAVRTLDTQLRAPGTPAQPDFPTFTSSAERAGRRQEAVSSHRGQVSPHPLGRHGPLLPRCNRSESVG